MSFWQAIILGIVEGITEFMPISSTFHLIWTSKLFGIPQSDFTKLFEVVIQAGAILAVVALYGREVFTDSKTLIKLVISFVPTALVGFLLHSVIKNVLFEQYEVSIVVFILVGGIFFLVERFFNSQKYTIEKMNKSDAFLIGFIQACAVMPGVSRAGAVMVGMMCMGYRRDESAKYSFLLAVPTISAAAFYDFYKMRDMLFVQQDGIFLLGLGCLVAGITAFFSVKWLISLLKKYTLLPFALYRVVVGIILLLAVSSRSLIG